MSNTLSPDQKKVLSASPDPLRSGNRMGKMSIPPGPQGDALREQERSKLAIEKEATAQEIARFSSMSTQELIQNAPVSDQQKRDWEKVRSVEFPKSEKVKLVTMIGGDGLNTQGEQELVSTAMKKPYPNLTVEPIRYEGPSGNAVDALRSKVQSSDKGALFVLFLSGHGTNDRKAYNENYVFIENSAEGINKSMGIKTDMLTQIMKTNPTKKFLLIVDSCHSGSILDESITKLPNVTGIIASSESGQVSDSSKDRGLFTDNFFTNVKKGMPLGEAFVRADLLTIMQTSTPIPPPAGSNLNPNQDPGMMIKGKKDHKIHVSELPLPKATKDNA